MIEDYGNEKGLNKENGFDPGDSIDAQKELQKEISHELGDRRNIPNRSYYIFESNEERNKALALVEEYRQADETFSYLKDNFGEDKMNDAGIALPFSKSLENQDQKIREFFERKGLRIIEIHKVNEKIDEIIVPDGNITVDVKNNLIIFPKEKAEKPNRSFPRAS